MGTVSPRTDSYLDAFKEEASTLQRAFEQFSQETSRLEATYLSLQKKFAAVNLKLEETNHQLEQKVQELAHTTNSLNNLLVNMSQGILFINHLGIITIYNPAAEQILGLPPLLTLNYSFWELFADDLFDVSLKEFLQQRKCGFHTTITYPKKAADSKILDITASFVKARGDIPEGMMIMICDVTEVRRLQAIAARDSRLKELGEMAAAVAHEIRNPLAGIEGFAVLLERDLCNDPSKQAYASHIVSGARTINRLVTHILDYARPVPAQTKKIALLPLLEEIQHITSLDPTLPKQVLIVVNRPKQPPVAPVDRDLLKAAIMNLVSNAIQAVGKQGTVTLSLATKKECICIIVKDTGVGIPQENMEKIFSPFFTTKHNGNGFGLAEAHKAVQAHGGTIEVLSAIGKGSTFTIKLPR